MLEKSDLKWIYYDGYGAAQKEQFECDILVWQYGEEQLDSIVMLMINTILQQKTDRSSLCGRTVH